MTLPHTLATLTESFSADELAQIAQVGSDARPEAYPPELRSKLQAVADQLSPDERNELLEALASDDVEGFMIKQPRVKEPGPGDVLEGGGGWDPIGEKLDEYKTVAGMMRSFAHTIPQFFT